MASLKNVTGEGWDEDILSALFNTREKTLIQKIPLSHRHNRDCWQWHHEVRGEYSEGSGKRLPLLNLPHPNASSLPATQGWKILWALPLPPKVKKIIWRACLNLLPTTKNLYIKHVRQDNCCPRCQSGNEDVLHALVLCPHARSVWVESLVGFRMVESTSFADWWWQIDCCMLEGHAGIGCNDQVDDLE